MYENLNRASVPIVVAERVLTTLRQIRGSISDITSDLFPKVEPEVALLDAQRLGNAIGGYLIDPLCSSLAANSGQEHMGVIEEIEKKYQGRRRFHRYSSPVGNVVSIQLPALLSSYERIMPDENPLEDMNYWPVLSGDNQRYLPYPGNLTSTLGVVSPLSSDYLLAALLQRFLQVHPNLTPFKLTPVLFTGLVFPEDLSGQRNSDFCNQVGEILVWTDQDTSGNTRRDATKAAKVLYPGKVIYQADRMEYIY